MRKIRSSFCLALITAFLVGCGSGQQQPPALPPTEVVAIRVEAKDVPVSEEFVAKTQSSHLVNIQARVSGFLDKRIYKEGDIVKKGDVLFLMDKKPFQAQVDAFTAALQSQKAALETAKLNLARVKPLSEQNALSQKDLDDARGAFETSSANVEQARAQLETALLNLSYCTITSPLDGITSAALQQEGTYLNMADSQLTTVAAISPIWVNFSLSDSQLQDFVEQVTKKQLILPKDGAFEVKVIQLNGTVFPYTGTITFTEPYFNPETGTFLIRASVENPQGVLRPNQYVRARVEGAVRPNAMLVPQRAVLQSSKGNYVWVVNQENKVEVRPIKVGDWKGENWFVNEGLSPGDIVVVDGGQRLHAGDTVKVTIQ